MVGFNVGKRTYFDNESSLSDTERGIENIARFSEMSKKYGFDASLLISTDYTRLKEKDQQRRPEDLVRVVRNIGIKVSYDTKGQTALSKFQQQVFPIEKPNPNTILAICCLDQYPLYTEEQVEVALELAEKVQKDRSLYGSGSRNVPVVLGVNKIPSDMRIIHELAQARATDYPDQFRNSVKPVGANPSASYEDLGEFTPGFYFFNPAHPAYPALAKEIQERLDLINRVGFSLEYLAAGTAGNIEGGVTTGYVNAVRNPFHNNPTEQEEKEKVAIWIANQTQQVASTSFGPHLRRFLADTERQKPLVELFDSRLVEETLEIMRKAAA